MRWQDAESLVRDGYRLADGAKGMLFIDATSPGAFDFPAGSLLRIDGGEWCSASSVAPFRGFGTRIHHWEVQVS